MGLQHPLGCLLTEHPIKGVEGWHLHALANDVDAGTEIVAHDMASSFAQLASEEAIEVVSGAGGDITQKLTIYGIDNAGNQNSEVISINGAAVVESSITWRYIENARLDVECAGLITIRKKTGDTFIMEIGIGDMHTQIVQHFSGEKTSYISYFDAGAALASGQLEFQLRWYPDDADCLGPTDGFIVLDRLYVLFKDGATELGVVNQPGGEYPLPIKCPPGGYIAVFVTDIDQVNNQQGWATVQGFDLTP